MNEMLKRKQEIRQAVLDIIFGNEDVTYEPSQYPNLKVVVAEVLGRKQGRNAGWGMGDAQLNEPDATILQEVFWDLIVERVLTIGMNDANPEFPWFRVHSEAKSLLKMK